MRFKQEVKKAFKDTLYPDNVPLLRDYTEADLIPMLSGKEWHSLSEREIGRLVIDLSALSDQAFAYFLPACFINLYIGEFKEILLHEFVYLKLVPPIEDEYLLKFNEKMKLFTLPQLKVIKRFVDHYVNFTYRPEGARVSQYWSDLLTNAQANEPDLT